MYLEEAVRASGQGSILSAHMLYTLGRTVWEFWIDDVPPGDRSEKAPDSLPLVICGLINACCNSTRFKTVGEVKEQDFEKLVENPFQSNG